MRIAAVVAATALLLSRCAGGVQEPTAPDGTSQVNAADDTEPPTNGTQQQGAFDGLWRVHAYTANSTETLVPPAGHPDAFGDRDALLFLNGELISVQAPCNKVGMVSAAVVGSTLEITGLSWTEMGCEPEVMALEEHLLTVIGAAPTLVVTGDALTLTASDDRRVNLVRVDPDLPLVTSSAVEQPTDEPTPWPSSVPPLPLSATSSEVPTPTPMSPATSSASPVEVPAG